MIYLATNNGVRVVQAGSGWQEVRVGLEGIAVTSVAALEGVVVAGTREGVFLSEDEGQTWQPASEGLNTRYVRWLGCRKDAPGIVLAGTEPAGIFVSKDGGRSWRERPEVTRLREALGWFLPYSPEAGCVRGFAFHASRILAAVEVGGVLVSEDEGDTWNLAKGSDGRPDLRGMREPKIHPDVHSIEIHPSSPDFIFAPTGGGFYRSVDGGATWKLLYDCYCRAVWVNPANARHIILGPADGVDSNGRIEESQDGGGSWQATKTGPWRRHMVERFFQAGDELFAVLSNGELLAARLPEVEWRNLVSGEVNAVDGRW